MEFYRTPHSVGTVDGGTIHGIMARDPATNEEECFGHVHVDVNGYARAVDYDSHPNFAGSHGLAPHVPAARAKRLLECGGAKFLGHPLSPKSRDVEVAALKARHGIA
jgi:hypothetical protein